MSVVSLARSLAEVGQNVSVAYGEGDFLAEVCTENRIDNFRLPHLKRTVNPVTNLRFLFSFRRLIDRQRYSIIHINSSNALLGAIAARFSRTRPRVVFTFRGLSFLDPAAPISKPARVFYDLLFWFLVKFVDESVFVSQANFEEAKRRRIVSSGRVVYNGLDGRKLEFLSPLGARACLAEATGKDLSSALLLGSIGRLAPQKNYFFLIRQMTELGAKFPELKLVIIGGGPEEEKLRRLILEEGLTDKVFLVGEMPFAYRCLLAFDVFVLTSCYEGMSITLIETLFAGVPVLASDVGGAKEQLKDEAQLFELDDRSDFQTKLEYLLSDPGRRQELARFNKDRSGVFGISVTARGYQKIYRDLESGKFT